MAKLFGAKGKTKSVTEAEVAVFKAEAALEDALARSDDPETDSQVRAARIRLAGAQAALDRFEKKFKLFGVVLALFWRRPRGPFRRYAARGGLHRSCRGFDSGCYWIEFG